MKHRKQYDIGQNIGIIGIGVFLKNKKINQLTN